MIQEKTVDSALQFFIRNDEINAVVQTDKNFKQIAKNIVCFGH